MDISTAMIGVQFIAGMALFIGHGIREFDVKANMKWFSENGYPAIAGAWQSFSEIVLALAMALGIFPRLAAAGIAFSMLGAMHYHIRRKDHFYGEWEAATLYLLIAVLVVFFGNGWIIGIDQFITLPAWLQ